MRRFVTLCVLLLFAIPFGVSVSGCAKKDAVVFCNGGDSGPTAGQVSSITLGPITSGISMNFAEIASIPQQPQPTDCKGQSAYAGAFTYGTTDMTLADVVPTGSLAGRLCAGTWNRNSGGAIADYTVCNPTNKAGVAYISVSAGGVTSNPLPVFVHPIVTSVVFGTNALGPNTGPVPTAAITGYSITNNVPTFTGGNSFTLGQVVSLYGFPSGSLFSHPISNAVVVPYTVNVTAWSIAGNMPTFTAANTFYAGETVALQNFPNSGFFNGISNAVVQQGVTSNQFTVSIPGFVHANASATETGTASGLSQSQFALSVPGLNHPNTANVIDTGYAGPVDCPTNPTTSCYPLTTVGSASALPYVPTACVSTGQTRQLVARVYAGTPSNPVNISSQVGPLLYQVTAPSSGSETSPVVHIDPNGVATAELPGSVEVTAYVATAASAAGFFSTCPPVSINLSVPGTTGGGPYVINQNNTLALSATAYDQNNVQITGLPLEYVSTAPTSVPTALATVTPQLAGAASITAICQPPACNSSAYNQIGLFGNGKPVVSNSINVVAPGSNSTVLYMASTQSKYMTFRDFTQKSVPASLLLPYTPNSMVINIPGSAIYMGSSSALMVVSAGSSLSVARVDLNSPGTVLAVSPDSSQVVISDPIKKVITIEQAGGGGAITTYGGVGTRAQYTPDGQTVYIAAGNQVLVYSAFTGWTSESPSALGGTQANDVAVTVPAIGAYFAGPATTDVSYCSISTPGASGSETNTFYPSADNSVLVGNPILNPVTTDRIAATNDGLHILGATVASGPTLNDLHVQIPSNNLPGPGNPGGPGPGVTVPCPLTGTLTFSNSVTSTPLAPIAASAITGVFPTSDSSEAFVTYTGSGGLVPAYAPAASGAGTIQYIPLSGSAIAPISGVLSADNKTFYTGTSGDNLVHIINRGTLADTGTLAPALPDLNGTPVPVDLLVQKPRTAN